MKIAWIGLGRMGHPMAGHLVKAGYDVTVYNRTLETAQAWVKTYDGQAHFAETPADAVREAECVCVCVNDDPSLFDVFDGEQGILAGLRPNALVIDHTTATASIAKTLAEKVTAKGGQFIDAPVSGGEDGAKSGQLTVMAGGTATAFAAAEPILAVYAKSTNLMGDVGAGQLTKMVNQICIAGTLQGLSEGVMLAKAHDLNIEKLIGALQHGAAGSWQLVNRAKTMANDDFDFGFAIDLMRKDLGICFSAADDANVSLPLAREVDARYAKLQQRGLNRCDTSVLIKQFDQDT